MLVLQVSRYRICWNTVISYGTPSGWPHQVDDSEPFFQMRTLRVREGGDSAWGPTVPAHFSWLPWPPLALGSDTADSLAGDGHFCLLIRQWGWVSLHCPHSPRCSVVPACLAAHTGQAAARGPSKYTSLWSLGPLTGRSSLSLSCSPWRGERC